jgi:hypothetical protein
MHTYAQLNHVQYSVQEKFQITQHNFMHAFDANFSAFHSLGFFETGYEGSKRKKNGV